MSRPIVAAMTLILTLLAVSPATARSPVWSSDTAVTMPKGRWELGLFQSSHWGAHRNVQLSVNPLVFFILPHFEAKVRWFHTGRWHLATKHRLSSPSVFLKIFAREGDFGLLPANTKVPVVFQLDSDVLFTVEWWEGQYATVKAGVVFAPRLTDGKDLPLLDFPFLYNRFAALNTTATARAGLSYEGQVLGVARLQARPGGLLAAGHPGRLHGEGRRGIELATQRSILSFGGVQALLRTLSGGRPLSLFALH